MSTTMARLAGDPPYRTEPIADILAERSASQQAIQHAVEQERGPDKLSGKRALHPKPPKPERRWIAPGHQSDGEPVVHIDQVGDLRLRKGTRVLLGITGAVNGECVRVAAEDGFLWIERCLAGDRFARRLGHSGEVRGGSIRHELVAAGFGLGRVYRAELDGARAVVVKAESGQ